MATSEHDVIVVGAGPAGASAAAVLGEQRRRVLLIDRAVFPRDKTCGDGITFLCREPLRRLGVLDEFRERATFATNGVSLFFSDGTELTLRRPTGVGNSLVYVLRRHDFDNMLLDAALRHPSVEFRSGVEARSLLMDGGSTVRGVMAQANGELMELRAPLTFDASGANSALATQVGAGNRDSSKCAVAVRGYYDGCQGLADAIEIYFDLDILPGYFWIFPTSAHGANVGCGSWGTLLGRTPNLRECLDRFLQGHPVASKKMARARLCGSLKGGRIPLANDAAAPRVRDGLLMLGDAGAMVNPITAEGISNAMKSGVFAGDVGARALEAGGFAAGDLQRYDELWRAEFGRQFASGAFLTRPLPRPAVTGFVHQRLASRPGLDAALADPGLRYELMIRMMVLMNAL